MDDSNEPAACATRLPRRAILHGLGGGIAAALGGPAALATPRRASLDRYPLPERLRGVNFEIRFGSPTPAMARQFALWGINLVRVNFASDACSRNRPDSEGPQPTADDPLAPYRDNIRIMKTFSAECARLGIRVVLAADQIFGRRLDFFLTKGGDDFRAGLKQYLCDFWAGISAEFQDDPAIVAYDALNEPNYAGSHPGSETPTIWQDDILPAVIDIIRRQNADIWIVVMPWPWGLAPGFHKMRHFEDPNIIYSFHVYSPHRYTHQGVGGMAPTRGKYTYPGFLQEYDTSMPLYWSRGTYRSYIQPAIDFRNRYRVRMLVGEFGVVRWAPGRETYLSDVVSLFEEEGFDWAFHSYGSWNGWNPSFAPDADPNSPPTEVDGGYHQENHRLLLAQWAKNRPPGFP